MRAFSDYNPAAIAVYLLSVMLVAMFCSHPVISAISALGAILFFLTLRRPHAWKTHLWFLALLLAMTAVNPIISHNGVTVLFVLSSRPVTLEALLYGASTGVMIVGVLYWFAGLSAVMTHDKWLYLLGSLSPKLALLLSMALRYVPFFSRQVGQVRRAQKGVGLYKEDNVLDRAQGNARVFSAVIGWTLENGVITADSMAARGYGLGRRTNFFSFRWRRQDALLGLILLPLLALCLYGIGQKALTFSFYPSVTPAVAGPLGIAVCAAYSVMVLIPFVLEGGARLSWRFYR